MWGDPVPWPTASFFLPTLHSSSHHRRLPTHARRHLSPQIQNSLKKNPMNSHPLTTPHTQGCHRSSIVIYFGEGGHKEESPSGPRIEFGVTGQEDLGSRDPCLCSRSSVEGGRALDGHFPWALKSLALWEDTARGPPAHGSLKHKTEEGAPLATFCVVSSR